MHHILVVDDDEIVAYAFTRYLKHYGYHVTVTHDSESALRVAEKIKVDAVITDYRIDEMNGLEMLAVMRKLQPALPAIIVSAYTDDFQVDDEKTRVLRKPVSLELLVTMVQEIIPH